MANKTGTLKKLILAIVVAIGLAIGGYFGLDLTEEDITNAITPIIEDVIGGDDDVVTEDGVPVDEATEEGVPVDEATPASE